MTLIETLAIEVGSSITKSLLKIWLKDSAMAADSSASIIDVLKSRIVDETTQRRTHQLLEDIGKHVGQRLLPIFQTESAGLDEGSCTAVALAVAQTLNMASSAVLVQQDLDATKLTTYLLAHPIASQHFNDSETLLFRRIVSESCQEIVAIASQLPTFSEHAFAEVLRREDLLLQTAEQILQEAHHEDERKHAEREHRLKGTLSDPGRDSIRSRLDDFIGRTQECNEMQQRITTLLLKGGYLAVTGQAGQGKSYLIAKLVQELDAVKNKVVYHFIPFKPGSDYQVSLLRDLIAQLIVKHGLSDLYDYYVNSEHRSILRDYFLKVMAAVIAKGGQAIIFIDGLDQLEEDVSGDYDLSFLPSRARPGVGFVLGTRPTEILHSLRLQVKAYEEYRLPNLSRDDFDLLLKDRKVSLDKERTNQFYEAMQQNTLYLNLIAKELAQEGASKPEEIIKLVTDNPENLFSLAIKRLKRKPHDVEWREVLKPVLGVLLVAREPLTAGQIRHILRVDDERLREGLVRLGGLISENKQQQYSLFHLKFYEYLRQDESKSHKEYVFAVDEEEGWHAQLAEWCERGDLAIIWQDLPRDQMEQGRREYARQHYIAHLYAAREWQRLFEVLDANIYGRAKVLSGLGLRFYIQDLDLGRQAAAWEGWTLTEGLAHLPYHWRYTLLRTSLSSQVTRYPLSAFPLLILLNEKQRAFALVELLSPSYEQVSRLLSMVKLLREQGGQEREWDKLLIRAQEIAYTIEDFRQQLKAMVELANALAQAQRWQRAEALWTGFEELARSLENPWKKVRVLAELAITLAKAQQWQQAEVVLIEAEVVVGTVEQLSGPPSPEKRNERWQTAGLAEALFGHHAGESIISAWPSDRDEALHALATALAQTQQWQQAERVINAIGDDALKAEAMEALAIALTRAQQYQRADVLWTEVEVLARSIWVKLPWRTGVIVDLTLALAQAQQWQRAETLVHSLGDSYVKPRAMAELANAQLQAQQWQQAEALLTAAEVVVSTAGLLKGPSLFGERDDEPYVALLALVNALAQAQQWERAEAIISLMKNSSWQARAMVELANALMPVHQHQHATALWTEAEKFYRLKPSGDRDKQTMALADTLIRLQHWQQAESVITSIEVRYEREEALQHLMVALIQCQRWQQAEAVISSIESPCKETSLKELVSIFTHVQHWQQTKTTWLSVQAHFLDRKMHPSYQINAVLTLASAYAQGQQWQQAEILWTEAERLVQLIEDPLTRSTELVDLINALGKDQQWQRVETLWTEAGRLVCSTKDKSPGYPQLFALMRLINTLGKAQRWHQAEELTNWIENEESREDLLLSLMRFLVQAQQWQRARSLINSLKEPDWRVSTSAGLAEMLVQAQQWQQAKELLTEADRLVPLIGDRHRRLAVLYRLARAFTKSQQWQQAKSVIDRIERRRLKVQALIALAAALLQERQEEWAKTLWTEVEAEIDTMPDRSDQVYAKQDLVIALAKVQQWQQAEALINTIENRFKRYDPLEALAIAYGQAKQWQRAEELVAMIRYDIDQTRALQKLAAEMTAAGAYETLLHLVQHSWLQVHKRHQLIDLLSLVHGLLPLDLTLGTALCEAFTWEDTFLQE